MAVSGLTSDPSSHPSAPPCDFIACLYDLLHAPDFPGCEPDLDSTEVEGGFRENVSHNAGSKLPSTLILFLREFTRSPGLMSLRFFPFMLSLL